MKVSVIIPLKKINDYLRQSIFHILNQTHQNFEIVVLVDEKTEEKFPKTKILSFGHYVGPAEKRDIGAQKATGEILAFLDDDAYPEKNWLFNALKWFEDPKVVGVCGPGVTPPDEALMARASGWVSASPLGGGNYTYRFLPCEPAREVDDYPSMNLLVRKVDFEKVGGFDTNFWPGDDTKLCLDLVKLGKKIIYDPKVLVYHHRRPLFIPHLIQNGRFGLHRGYFAKILPQTSFRLSYFIPVFFTLGLILGPVLILSFSIFNPPAGEAGFPFSIFLLYLYLASLFAYCLLLLYSALWVFVKSVNLQVALLVIPGIFLTHVWYGLRFIQGYFFTKKLKQ